MTIPTLTVRPILHTEHADYYRTLFGALGARTLTDDPMWTELELDRGRVTITALNRDAVEGDVDLGFETTDLDAFLGAVRPTDGMAVERFVTEDAESIRVVGRDGLSFLVDALIPSQASSGTDAWIEALWITTDVTKTAEDLETLGLSRRLTELNGRTVDLRADQGDVLVHTNDGGPIGATVAIRVASLDDAHKALIDAGIAHDVIDETHGRTLKVPMPGTDQMLWIEEPDPDPIGVVRH